MPKDITHSPAKPVCAVSHTAPRGANNAQTSYRSVFDWNTGEPSIFATPEELRRAKISAISAANATSKKHKTDKNETRRGAGRPSIHIDLDLLQEMIDSGTTRQQCAEHFGVSSDTIRLRLGTKSSRVLRDNTASSFNVPIATKAQSDRTNSISR